MWVANTPALRQWVAQSVEGSESVMAKPRIKINEAGVREVHEEASAPARQIVREVRGAMQGEPADTIHPVLVERLRAAGMQPNVEQLRVVAEEISAGTLTD